MVERRGRDEEERERQRERDIYREMVISYII